MRFVWTGLRDTCATLPTREGSWEKPLWKPDGRPRLVSRDPGERPDASHPPHSLEGNTDTKGFSGHPDCLSGSRLR